jgi:hypothetical protein
MLFPMINSYHFITVKIPPCSKALSAEHIGLNFAALHLQW